MFSESLNVSLENVKSKCNIKMVHLTAVQQLLLSKSYVGELSHVKLSLRNRLPASAFPVVTYAYV